MKVDTRVRYIRIDNEEVKSSGYYPPSGTLGTVKAVYEEEILVKWDAGTIDNGEWYCELTDVEIVDVANSVKEEPKMTIYIIERNNPYNTPEPEVVRDGNLARKIVREEYEAQMAECGISQEEADAGLGLYGCYWGFGNSSFTGEASIEYDLGVDTWRWRVTKHEI